MRDASGASDLLSDPVVQQPVPVQQVPVPVPVQTPPVQVTVNPQPIQNVAPVTQVLPTQTPSSVSPSVVEVPQTDVTDIARMNLRQAQDVPFQTVQERSDIIGRVGKDGVGGSIEAQGWADTQAAEQRKQAEAREQYGVARGFSEKSQGREELDANEFEKRKEQKRRELDDYLDKSKHVPKDSKVFGILAAVAAMGGNSQIATGLQMFNGLQQSNIQKWHSEMESQRGRLGALDNQIGVEQSNMAHEGARRDQHFQDADHLLTMSAKEIDAGLKAAIAGGMSEKSTLLAKKFQLELRDQTAAQKATLEVARQKAARASSGTKADTELYNLLAGAEGNPAEQMRIANTHPAGAGRGQDVLQDYYKSRTQLTTAQQQEAAAKQHEQVAEWGRIKAADEHAKALREAAAGPKMSEGEQKLHNIIGSRKDAYARLWAKTHDPLTGRVLEPNEIDTNSRTVNALPDMLRSEGVGQEDKDIDLLTEGELRMESGGAFGKDEIANHREARGSTSSDSSIRAKALLAQLQAYEGADKSGQLANVRQQLADAAAQREAERAAALRPKGIMGRGNVPRPAVVNGVPGTVGGTKPAATKFPSH
jgi:hypothetical protein